MFKVRMFGAIDSLSTVLDFDTALAILSPAFGNSDVSGDIVDCETGEVLVMVTDGEVTHIVFQMLDKMFEEDPEGTLAFCLGLLMDIGEL